MDMKTNRAKAFSSISKRIRRGGNPYAASPEALPLHEITTHEPLFQTRSPSEDESETHVRKLYRTIIRKSGSPLDPIQVFWIGDTWCCIDGHHRLKAYKRAVEKGHWQTSQPVPVEVFRGSLLEASAEGGEENGKARLAMQESEKNDHAWSFVILDAKPEFSKSETADKTGVSTSTIGNMRRVLAFFKDEKPIHDPADFRWKDAAYLEQYGEEREGKDAEELRRQEVERFARLLRKTFKEKFSRDASLLVDVVREAYSADFLPALSRAVAHALSANDDEVGRETAGAPSGDF